MSEQTKFEVGDRVMCTNDGSLGVITFVDIDEGKYINNGYEVRFDNGCEEWINEDMLVASDEPPYDPKTAFLSELKELLEKYNAEIEYHMGGDDKSDYSEYYAITIGGDRLTYDNCEGVSLTSDNIMDYDKE